RSSLSAGSSLRWRALRPSIPPKILEPIRRELSVADGVLDILVPHPGLDRPGVVTGIRRRIAAAVPQDVRVDPESHPCALTEARNQRRKALRRDRAAALRAEHIRAGRLFAL